MSSSVNSPEPQVVVAAFDFDKTLTVSDTVVPFLLKVAGPLGFARVVARNVVRIVVLAVRRDRNGMKELVADAVFKGRDADIIEDLGVLYAEQVVSGRMRADTCERMRAHQQAGHVVVLVSASFGTYLHPVGDMLGVDAVLCTELEVDGGSMTGRLSGPNCRGDEKRRRLTEWLDDAGLGSKSVGFAYGDSSGDVEMLAMASHPVRVGSRDLDDSADVSALLDGTGWEHGS